MPQGCVFNECCLEDVKAIHDAEREDLFRGLQRIVRAVGMLRRSDELLTFEIGGGVSLQLWLRNRLTQRANAGERDELNQIAFALVSLSRPFTPSEDALATLAEDASRDVVGLLQAHQLGELAVSLATSGWQRPFVPIQVLSGECDADPRIESVHHASLPAHLVEHRDWLGRSEVAGPRERLRLRLHTAGRTPRHVPASTYCRRKHVRGNDNEARQRTAKAPAGASQYFARLPDGTEVSDEHITSWEQGVLARVSENRDTDATMIVVQNSNGGTFHIYAKMDHEVGYVADRGDKTAWMRVEWSSSEVHSHPHEPQQ